MTKIKRVIETRRLDELLAHPQQATLFDDLNEHDLQVLADDIAANGLQHLIQILPPDNSAELPANTIVRGHQRRRALELLGRMECKVIVLYDLADADRAAVDLHFMSENLHRRQLDNLAKARVALAVFEIERGRECSKFSSRDATDARDRVGKTIGMSGRNLQRYWNLLHAPLAVQNAFRAGMVSLVEGARVGLLGDSQQFEIADRIEAGESVRTVVGEALVKRRQVVGKASAQIGGMLRGLALAGDLVERLDHLAPHRFANCKDQLQAGMNSLKALIAFAKRKQ